LADVAQDWLLAKHIPIQVSMALGVLHSVPDTAAAIRSCAALLKPGAPLLLYLY